MPTVSVNCDEISQKLGNLDETQVDQLCWSYGLELDEVTSEYLIVKKEQGEEKAKDCSKEIIYKIEVPANRYDLLCVEGLTRAFTIFEGKMNTPIYRLSPKEENVVIKVDDSVKNIRPFVVGAILRNITFNKERYNSFIQLQDKLHQNIGKRRQIVSIGTHDFDTLEGPFLYTARTPEDINFIPLNDNKKYSAKELMILYSKESHLKPYLSIIKDFDKYPVIYDRNNVVCSMPPIINGEHSKIKYSTKNVFIEITGTNLHKISVALDTMVTMFSEYCDDQFTIEPVEIHNSDGSVLRTPELSSRIVNVSTRYINDKIGTSFTPQEIGKLLEKMSLKTEIVKEESNGTGLVSVNVPPTRHDIIHPIDIVEDVAIAFGYDNIGMTDYERKTESGETSLSRLTREVRILLMSEHFTEALSFCLCSRDDVSKSLGKEISEIPAVHISNPKTPEFQVVRTTLVPGLLHTISSNQHLRLPLKVFEVQDIVVLNDSKDVRAGNIRRACAVYYGVLSDFDYIYNTMTTVMNAFGYNYKDSDDNCSSQTTYEIVEMEESMFLSGRSYRIVINGNQEIGKIGIVKPDILKNFGIKKGMASLFEIDIEPFL